MKSEKSNKKQESIQTPPSNSSRPKKIGNNQPSSKTPTSTEQPKTQKQQTPLNKNQTNQKKRSLGESTISPLAAKKKLKQEKGTVDEIDMIFGL